MHASALPCLTLWLTFCLTLCAPVLPHAAQAAGPDAGMAASAPAANADIPPLTASDAATAAPATQIPATPPTGNAGLGATSPAPNAPAKPADKPVSGNVPATPATAAVTPPLTADDAAKGNGETTMQDKSAARPQAENAAASKADGGPVDGNDAAESMRQAVEAYAKGDHATARTLWEKLAAKGDGQAMNNLGVLYDRGQGVEPDMGRALHWFAQSAAAGHPSGMSNYGRMLDQGRGTTADPAAAARWFDLAARKGQPEAQYNLALMYEQGRALPKDVKAAAAWLSRAAAQQQTEALARLGHFYREGIGVAKDGQRATLLLYAAAMNGHRQAMEDLEAMARENPAKASAVLFGQKLDDTNRKAMRAALRKSGTPAKREKDGFICDLYDVRKKVPGASQMAVCYGPAPDAALGFLSLDYPAPDSKTARAVEKMVEDRFGPSSAGEGDDARLWNLGSVIVATKHSAADKVVSLMYMVPRVYHTTQAGR